LAVIAESVLAERVPPYRKRSGRGTRTRVACRGEEKVVGTAKAAYLWLQEKSVATDPELFTTLEWRHAFIADGTHRHDFARTPRELLDRSPLLADDSTMFARLSYGWFVNLNIGDDQSSGS
jgi:hypothetical protein